MQVFKKIFLCAFLMLNFFLRAFEHELLSGLLSVIRYKNIEEEKRDALIK